MNDIKLRQYQENFISAVRAEFKAGQRRVCGVAPCGAGKTIMTGWIIKESLSRGKTAIFFVHRNELIEQTSKTFSMLDIPHGIIAANNPPRYDLPVQIASVQTLVRRLDKVPAPALLICDECHHILANTYLNIISKWSDAYLLGVTATPERTGGIGLGDIFSSMVLAPSTADLISLGNLTKFKYYAPKTNLNLNGVKVRFGEYDNKQLAERMEGRAIIGGIVENYRKFADGKSAICYCVNIEHSKMVADAFNRAGIIAAHCDGETPKLERSQIVEDFRQGKIKILCNAELFGEGFDVPNMQAVILARPTQSLTLYIQQSMRAMRPDPAEPNKTAIIIDHVQNYLRFGLPDMARDWQLFPEIKKSGERKPHVKKCPNCERVIPAAEKVCEYCGHEFISLADDEERLKENVGELEEIYFSAQSNKKIDSVPTVKRMQSKIQSLITVAKNKGYKAGWVAYNAMEYASTLEDFQLIANACGYKKGWAWHKWQENFNYE